MGKRMSTTEKRKKTTAFLLKALDRMDTFSDTKNAKFYRDLFNGMTDSEFDQYMRDMRDGNECFYVYMPNMSKRPSLDTLIEIAKENRVEIFHRIKMLDEHTGEYFVTSHKYPVLRLPIRRMQQFLDKKMSVPRGDTKVNSMTGQVAFEDQSAKLSNPEIQALQSKGLSNTLNELVAIRGGNVEAWSGEMKRQAEEQGKVLLSDIDGGTSRTAQVTQVLLECMMLSTNLTER
jgi:hypothetical protein